MGVSLELCQTNLPEAVDKLFDSDKNIQAVGIARHEGGFCYKAVRNAGKIVAFSAAIGTRKSLREIKHVPVIIESASADIEHHLAVPHPLVANTVPERSNQRPLVCGLQIQNVDDDTRQRAAGNLQPGYIIIGTLGCFVHLTAGGSTAILSNNHVLAGENRGKKNKDRILQPGDLNFNPAEHVATLTNFVKLAPSPANATPSAGNVVYNKVDCAVAKLEPNMAWQQQYLASRPLPQQHGTAVAQVGDKVFKVGRTTGLTHGTVTAVSTVVGPITYAPGPVWFQGQIEIVGDNGTLFSDHGDSGSAIVRTSGEVVGLLYAGNGQQTYACQIADVLSALKCTLA